MHILNNWLFFSQDDDEKSYRPAAFAERAREPERSGAAFEPAWWRRQTPEQRWAETTTDGPMASTRPSMSFICFLCVTLPLNSPTPLIGYIQRPILVRFLQPHVPQHLTPTSVTSDTDAIHHNTGWNHTSVSLTLLSLVVLMHWRVLRHSSVSCTLDDKSASELIVMSQTIHISNSNFRWQSPLLLKIDLAHHSTY